MSDTEIRARLVQQLEVSTSKADLEFLQLLRILEQPEGKSLIAMVKDCGIDRDIFRGAELHARDFSTEIASGFAFDACHIAEVNFSKAELTKTEFLECELRACRFFEARGRSTRFAASNIHDSVFAQSKFDNLTVTDSTFHDCDFRGAQLHGARIYDSALHGMNFQDAYLNASEFRGGKIVGGVFASADISRTIFDAMTLQDVRFETSIMMFCDLRGLDLTTCHFQYARLSESNFFGCAVRKEAFDNADLEGARFGENPGLDHRGEDEFAERGAVFPKRVRAPEPA